MASHPSIIAHLALELGKELFDLDVFQQPPKIFNNRLSPRI